MRALPARRIALGALCAALLAGVTGPAAMAADTRPTPTEPLAQAWNDEIYVTFRGTHMKLDMIALRTRLCAVQRSQRSSSQVGPEEWDFLLPAVDPVLGLGSSGQSVDNGVASHCLVSMEPSIAGTTSKGACLFLFEPGSVRT